MNQQSFIYNLLLESRYRIWRYFLLFSFFTIVSLNQGALAYQEVSHLLGNKIYLITIATILVYVIVFYITLRIFIPKYLFTGKFFQFMLCIVINAIIFEIIPNAVYFYYDESYDLLSEKILIDNVSSFFMYILCISGVIIPVFLRNWLISHRHVNELKKKQQISRIEQLKEQVNPDSFFNILNKSKTLVKTEPEKASGMLMKLSQLLRYQLYDCNRDLVLLSAEIAFLRNFLELENLYSSKFDYTIMTTGNTNVIFVPPSILLPYIQCVTNIFNKNADFKSIHIHISVHNDTISVILKVSGIESSILLEKELLKVKDRLNTLYKNRYMLAINSDKSTGETEIGLTLEKK